MEEQPESHKAPLNSKETPLLTKNQLDQKRQELIRKRFRLSEREIDLLKLLAQKGAQKINQILEDLQMKRSSLTPILKGLQNKGLIKRIPSRADRRMVFIYITSKGNKILADFAAFERLLEIRLKLLDD